VPPTAPSRALVALLIAFLCLVWGSTWIVIADGLRDLPPFTSAAARFLVAALAMSALAPAIARREGGRAPTWRLRLALGGLNFAASYAIVYWTETKLPSGVVSVLWAIFPMLMAASSSWFLRGEQLRPAQWAGFALGFAGVALLFATDLRAFGPEGVPAAAVLLLSPLVSCVGNTLLKRDGKDVSSALVNRDGMWIGAGVLVVLALTLERGAPAEWTGRAIGSVVYLALVGTVATFGLYFWLLRHTEAWRLSTIAYVTPAVALLLGTLLKDEPFTRWTLAGSLTILAGVVLAAWRPARRS
jgi:drug/metabolite transporter (DMT)-like permease